MSRNKLFILIIAVTLLFANFGFASAAAPAPVPQPPTLNLKVSFSPLPIYPPLVFFTATLSRVPPSSIPQVVDYFLVAPTLCADLGMSMTVPCVPSLKYLGSAQINQYGQAVLSLRMKPGAYTVVARIRNSTITMWSNYVSFSIP